MLVVPELEREVELLWELRDTRKVFCCNFYLLLTFNRSSVHYNCQVNWFIKYAYEMIGKQVGAKGSVT